MKLVSDWKRCWRWFSMQSLVLSGGMLTTWLIMPDDLKASLPPPIVVGTAATILFLGAIGRVVDQKKP